jgi:hypothetical protein
VLKTADKFRDLAIWGRGPKSFLGYSSFYKFLSLPVFYMISIFIHFWGFRHVLSQMKINACG